MSAPSAIGEAAGEGGAEARRRRLGGLERLALACVLGFPFVGFFRGFRLWVGTSLALYGLVSLAWLSVGLFAVRASGRPRPSWWDAALVGCGAWMALATAVAVAGDGGGIERRLTLTLLWYWGSGILLALYARRRYGTAWGSRFILGFATAILSAEVVVCLAQYQALSGDGVVESLLRRAMHAEDARDLFTVGGGGVRVTRAIGTFYHANAVGTCIVLLLPFLVHRLSAAWQARSTAAAAGALAVLLPSLAILLRNLSRASIVVGAIVLAAAVWVEIGRGPHASGASLRRRWRRPALALGLVLLGAAGAWVAGDVGGGDLARVVRARLSDRDTAGVRLGLVRAAGAALLERPLLGLGYGRGTAGMPGLSDVAGEVSASAAERYRGAGARQAPAHNLYLMMAMDGGLPALILFLIAAGTVAVGAAKGLRRLPPADACLAVSVLGGLLLGVAEPLVYDLFWPFLLFAMGSLRAALAGAPAGGRL